MMIPIYYRSGTFDLVHPSLLDALLSSGRVAMFCRHEGWVEVDRDSLRTHADWIWTGRERRSLH